MGVDWKGVKGEKGIMVRDYGTEKCYLIQQTCRGRAYRDLVGSLPLDRVKIIRDMLSFNRRNQTGPQTWLEMQKAEAEREQAKAIEEAARAKEILEAERRRQVNTVARLWEDVFWPYRLSLLRSQKETRTMNARWLTWVKPFFGDMPLTEIDGPVFMKFVKATRKAGKLSDSSIFKCIIDLRQMWNYALENQYVSIPFPGKATAREVQRGIDNEKRCWLEPDEVRLLIRTVWERRLNSRVDHDVYCFVILGVALGLRAGDICKLTRQAVERHIIDKTKNRRSRFVHFNYAPVRAMLDERLSLYPPDTPESPLFMPQTPKRKLKGEARMEPPRKYFDLIKELGFNEVPRRKNHPLEKIDFHALRHTFATLAAMRGVDHLTLMRLMGHKTPAMTLRYIEIADAHQAKYQEQAMQGIFPKELEGGEREIGDGTDDGL